MQVPQPERTPGAPLSGPHTLSREQLEHWDRARGPQLELALGAPLARPGDRTRVRTSSVTGDTRAAGPRSPRTRLTPDRRPDTHPRPLAVSFEGALESVLVVLAVVFVGLVSAALTPAVTPAPDPAPPPPAVTRPVSQTLSQPLSQPPRPVAQPLPPQAYAVAARGAAAGHPSP